MIEFLFYFLMYCFFIFWGGLLVKLCVTRFKRRDYYWFGVYLLNVIFLAAWLIKIVIMA